MTDADDSNTSLPADSRVTDLLGRMRLSAVTGRAGGRIVEPGEPELRASLLCVFHSGHELLCYVYEPWKEHLAPLGPIALARG